MPRAFAPLCLLLLLISVTPRLAAQALSGNTVPAIPDYALLHYWAAHPHKHDPSDSLPKDLKGEVRDSLADVFFIHPTTYTGTRKRWNATFDDERLNSKTDETTILYQASVFNGSARVFAPRYRQVHLSAFYTSDAEARAAFDTAYADLRNAFLFYLEHHHRQRPIIIAGHSQGGLMAMRLLKEFFDGQALSSKLVAAYVIGWPLPQDSFTNLKACETAEQTGCVCSWRTFREGYVPDYVNREPPLIVTNPLSWKRDSASVPRSANEGSILRNFRRVIRSTTGARVAGNVVWVEKPRFPGSLFFITKNYHIADINLFYMSLRRNVKDRIQNFRK